MPRGPGMPRPTSPRTPPPDAPPTTPPSYRRPRPPPTRRAPPPPRLRNFQFQVEKSLKGGSKISSTYEEDQLDKLIKDVWVWMHEDRELEISIIKTRV